MEVPQLGPSVPQRGNEISRGFGRAVMRLIGWRFEGPFPDLPKCVAIVAPHTSNWDFLVGLAAMLALGLDNRWLGKHTIFVGPFGPLWRWLGGIAVNRTAATAVADRAVAAITGSERICVAIAPEGTRKRVERWKTGFHRIALGAGVPILPIAFDYRKRAVVFFEPFQPTADLEADINALQALYRPEMACRPEGYGVRTGCM
jgi:1-acyl-sn-glycerol-3-phosphate acyltransferase